MTNNKLKVGVVGTGHLGRVHARIYHQMDEFELAGIVDANAGTSAEVASEFACPILQDVAALINNVDAVSIVVPTSVHAEVTQPCLEAGVPVLLEKPIAATVEQAQRLVDISGNNGTPLLIGHLERFNPALTELRGRLREPYLIEARRLNPFSSRATDVDVVTDLMIHDLDIVSSLLGEVPDDIQAVGRPIITDKTDIASAQLRYPGGTVASFTASRISQQQNRRLRVYQTDGYLELDFNGQQLVVAEYQAPTAGQDSGRMEYSTISPVKVQPLQAEIAHFYQVVRHGAAPRVPGAEGMMALRQVVEINGIIAAARGERI